MPNNKKTKAESNKKLEIAVQSLNFYQKERNKALFRVSKARNTIKQAKEDEAAALKDARSLKARITSELKRFLTDHNK